MTLLTNLTERLWTWLLPLCLTAAAIRCGIAQRFQPLSHMGKMFRSTYGSLLTAPHDRSQRARFATALAATMGTGNLIGTAAAIAVGGAGAVFWMWISALLGMLLVYAENTLGIQYRKKNADGTWYGGAAACLRYGLHSPLLAGIFAGCCALAGLGMGSMAQAQAMASAAETFGIPRAGTGMILCAVGVWILRGGAKTVGSVTVWLMPLLCGFYLLGCMVLLVLHYDRIPHAFACIFSEASGFRGMAGGFCGTVFLRGMSVGLRRGIFSNEAGLGTSSLLHMDAEKAQGEWAAAEVFADTLICCTATALVILTSPQEIQNADGAAILLAAFSEGFGAWAGWFLALALLLFAFATFLGWFPCGCAAVQMLFPRGGRGVYTALWLLAGWAGALGGEAGVLALCDFCNACMALPNLYALCRLAKTDIMIKGETMHENS